MARVAPIKGSDPWKPPCGERLLHEVHHVSVAPHERLVEVLSSIGRENGQALVLLQTLHEVPDIEVGVAVVRVLHIATRPEQGVGFVEEQHRASDTAESA